MPRYEYGCDSCGHVFTVEQARGEEADGLSCVKCGAMSVARRSSPTAATRRDAAPAPPVDGCCGGRCGCALR